MKFILRLVLNSRALCLMLTAFLLIFHDNLTYAQTDTIRKLTEVRVLASPLSGRQSLSPAQRVSTADFKKSSSYNVADAIRNFSGVNIKDYGGIGGMKTVSVRSLGANHTAVQYDGVQISDNQNGQVDLGRITLENLQDITLYNGQPGDILIPARSLASASVLVINSLRPALDSIKPYKLQAGLKTGSFGLMNPSLQWQQRINERWSFNLSSSLQRAHGRYRYKVDGDGSDTLATRTNAALSSAQTELALFWAARDSSKFNLRANFNNSDRGLPGAVVYYNPYSSQQLRSRDYFIQSAYHQKWSRLQLLLNTKFSNNYTRYLDPDYLNSAGALDQRYTQQEIYGSAVLSYRLTEQLELAYASDAALSTLRTNLYQYAYPRRYTHLNALFSRFHWSGLTLQATLLHTSIHEHVSTGTAAGNRSVWSPAILASYQPAGKPELLIRAFYKDIFRNPTFNDLYYTRIGSRSLKPEYASQYNLGLTLTKTAAYADYITLTTDIYYNRIRDKIIALPNKDLFTWSMLNLGRAAILGSDIGLKTGRVLTPTLSVHFSGNYTFQKSLDVTDQNSSLYLNQLPYTPQHTFSLNAGMNGARWSIAYNQIYSSSRYYELENLPMYRVPGFMVSDLSTTYRWNQWRFPMSASAELNNLFNRSYSFIRSYPMPGRSIRLSFQVTI